MHRITLLAVLAIWPAAAVGQSRSGSGSPEQHRSDVEQLTRWWLQSRREWPTEAVARLEQWVKDHPEDGESLFLLSRVEDRKESRNRSVPLAERRSVKLVKAAAAAGHPAAAATLGGFMLRGHGVQKDVHHGLELIRAAADQDDPNGHAMLGSALVFPDTGVPQDFPTAHKHLLRAAEQGMVKAYYLLWMAYDFARRGKDGLPYLRKGAESGSPDCQAVLGRLYATGTLVPQDRATAEKWLRPAAEFGDPEYQRVLAEFYKETATPRSAPEVIKWFQLASDGGDMKARYWVAVASLNGQGVPMEVERGLALLREAAQANIPDAQWFLGSIYLEGVLVDRDVKEARRWFESAAAGRQQSAVTMLRWLDYAERNRIGPQ